MKAAYIDTSALAKYYIAEPGSDAVQDLLLSFDEALISRLTEVEFRCVLARRRRARHIDAALEISSLALFLSHVAQSFWRVQPVVDGDFDEAARLIDRLGGQALRTLDALHLACALRAGVRDLVTADRAMARAARALGFAAVPVG